MDIIIAGIGQTPVGEHWELSLREIAFHAMQEAMREAGELKPQALYVSNVLAAQLSGQAHLGTLLADFAGLRGVEACTIEAGGASGGAALRAALQAIQAGHVDTALVVGVEKLTDKIGPAVENALATTLDADYEAVHGLTPTAQAALLMQRYFHEFSPPEYALGGFPLIAHAHGAGNPNAMFRKAIKESLYQRAGMVSAPLNMFDAAPDADGAAAVLLARADLLPPDLPKPPVRVVGSGAATDTLAVHDRPDPLAFRAARLSIERALHQAGITRQQVDFFEPFDAFSIYAALSLEAAGFADRGQGWQWAQEEKIGLRGELPMMTMGGLKARGNPWGATGVYQVVEAVLQLRGEAGENQIPNARVGMVQCLGGPASTAITHILARD